MGRAVGALHCAASPHQPAAHRSYRHQHAAEQSESLLRQPQPCRQVASWRSRLVPPLAQQAQQA